MFFLRQFRAHLISAYNSHSFVSLSFVQSNLASLLKTAEELRIKGLAEVSWRDDDVDDNENNDSNNNVTESSPHIINPALPATTTTAASSTSNGKVVPFLAPSTSPGDAYSSVNRKKRGRPPLDEPVGVTNFGKG